MRKVVLYTLMSLDGAVDHPARYFAPGAGPGQAPEFDSVMDDNEGKIIGAQDAVLLGRHCTTNGRSTGRRSSTSRSPNSSTASRSTS